MDLTLIDQQWGMVKSPAPIDAAFSSVSERRCYTPEPPQMTQMEMAFSLSHKPFWGGIKTLSEDNKCFVCGNRHPDPGKCYPVLEACSLVTKDEEGWVGGCEGN